MKIEPPIEAAELEDQLKQAAPTLPPALRRRTLLHCVDHVEASRHRRRRGHRRLAWAIAGLCAFHWLTTALLDSQQAALLRGPGPSSAPLYASSYASSPACETSPTDVQESLRQRSHILATFIANNFGSSTQPG